MYPFHLGKEIIGDLINYVSNLITDSHFENLFSGTNPRFIYWIIQVPSGKQIVHSKGTIRESSVEDYLKECGQSCVKPTRNGKAPG